LLCPSYELKLPGRHASALAEVLRRLKRRPSTIDTLEKRQMNLKHLTVSITAALALTLAGAVMAESAKEKAAIAGAVKADQAQSSANAVQNEANKLQGQADKAEKEAAAAKAKAAADPTAATKHAAEVKTKEAVDAAGVAGDMEKKAAAKSIGAESTNIKK
jgi:CHASE3 domain sensor protein